MIVHFSVRGSRPPDVRRPARAGVLAALGPRRAAGPGLLSVVWTTREQVRDLNRRFRGTDRFTDVIAFRYGPGGAEGPSRRRAGAEADFGDLFIAVPQARLNARRFGVTFREELVRLAVHGTLHLLGYTDYVPRERRKMWSVQEKIIKKVLRVKS